MLCATMLSVAILSVLSVTMLSITMLCVVMLSIVMLNVMASQQQQQQVDKTIDFNGAKPFAQRGIFSKETAHFLILTITEGTAEKV